MLGEKILRTNDQLSKTLQNVEFSTSDRQEVAKMTLEAMQNMHSDEAFWNDFWDEVNTLANESDVEGATTPRKEKEKCQRDLSKLASHHMNIPATAKDYYHQAYSEAFNLATTGIWDCLGQPSYMPACLRNLKELLLKSALHVDCENWDAGCHRLLQRYDFKADDLKSQLTTMNIGFCRGSKDKSWATVNRVVQYVQGLSACQKSLLPHVIWLMKLYTARDASQPQMPVQRELSCALN